MLERLRSRESRRPEGLQVTLSSIHRAKGLEARRVFVLGSGEVDAANGWQAAQEHNLKYVAVTRARGGTWMVEPSTPRERLTSVVLRAGDSVVAAPPFFCVQHSGH